MSANANNLPSQHARSTNPPQATASGGAKQRASEEEPQFTLKPFKISKVATAAQRRAHRQASIGATDARKEEFARKWCSYDPFKPIWRPPEPKERPAAAKRKAREVAEQAAAEEAGLPKHLELDRWLRHVLMLRRREEERKDKARQERQQLKEERDGKGKDLMTDGEEDRSESVEDERGKTLQERLMQAQMECAETGSPLVHQRDEEGVTSTAAVRKMDGCRGDGVRRRLHSADRLQGLQPGLFINLFPGGFSVEGETTGRSYDMDSKEFLAGLDRGRIPARKLLELSGHSNLVYSDGYLVVEVRDFRLPRNVDQKPAVWLMALEPDSGVVAQDLSTVAESHQNLSTDDLLLVEKRMLLVTQPSICLSPHPHVATIANSLHRRANRMSVWHARSTRSSVSQFRRSFDAGAMRRLHAAVHICDTPGLDPVPISLKVSSHVPSLAASSDYTEEDSMVDDGDCPALPKPTCTGMWKGNKLLEGWDLDGDGKNGALLMATALRQLKASARSEKDRILPGGKSSHGLVGVKKEGRGEKAADGSERGLPRNYFLPRQYLRDGMPPERQMRFRKDNQVVTIAIEKKDASTYQLRSWLHEYGPDGKALENSQVSMMSQIVGNSSQARLFGGQLFSIYHKEGWQCTGDSHQPSRAKQGASGGSAQGAASNGERSAAAARPGAQAPQGNSRVAASPANAAAGRGASPAGRGMVAGGFAHNGQTAMRNAAPKAKQAQHATAHPAVTSPHMMAGRSAPVHGAMPPGAGAAGQPRAPMGQPGAVPAQQQYMQQGYRPPVAMHQAPPPQQHHAHQVAPAHAAHAAQGVQYHAAAGRGYVPHAHHPQVAGRGVAPVQPGARPAVANVSAPASAAPHQVYKSPHAPHAMPQQPQAPSTQSAQAGMAMSGPMQQHAGMGAGGVAMVHRPAQPAQGAVKPPVVSPTAGRGQAPPMAVPQTAAAGHQQTYQHQPPKANH